MNLTIVVNNRKKIKSFIMHREGSNYQDMS